MIVLGIDLGARRVGLAISDPDGRLAVMADHLPVRSAAEAVSAVDAAARRLGAEALVVGLPRRLDGRTGPEAKAATAAAHALSALGWRVALWDERLTTAEAHRALKDAQVSRKRRKDLVDSVAAQRLLSSWLECAERRDPAGLWLATPGTAPGSGASQSGP